MECKLFESVEFQRLAARELDWEGSHAHWVIEDFSDDVLLGVMTMQEALVEWRRYLNDMTWDTITEAEAVELERGETDDERVARWKRERDQYQPMDRWQLICKCN